MSNPQIPVAVDSFVLENDKEVKSYSTAELDPRAVQYDKGILVIPVTMHPYEDAGGDGDLPVELDTSFSGFIGLDLRNVSQNGITEVLRVNYSNPVATDESCNYCRGFTPTHRSMLFRDGRLMTMHGHLVANTNVSSGAELWTLNITLEGNEGNCCYW